MTLDHVHALSLAGTVTIWLGGVWILVGGIAYMLRVIRHRPAPTVRNTARATRKLRRLLGEPDLTASAAHRAVRVTAQYEQFRTWTWWAFRAPLIVLIAGESLHLAGNVLALHRHEIVHTWRIASNGIGLLGSIVLCAAISRLLLSASPRLAIIRHLLASAGVLEAMTEDRRGDNVDRVLRQLGRLDRSVTAYFTLSHPAGDPYTRARLTSVSDGVFGLLVDARQHLLFADALTLMSTRQTLWMVAAAAAADPKALADAERAGAGDRRTVEGVRPRLIYRTAAVLTALAVIGVVIGLWYVDHSALSVIFSAVAAPLLIPAVIGFSRRGWSHHPGGADAKAEEAVPLVELAAEISASAKEAAI